MKLTTRKDAVLGRTACPSLTVMFLCMAGWQHEANAQAVLAPPTVYSLAPPAVQSLQTNEMDVFPSAEVAAAGQPEPPPWQWGPVGFRPHVFARFIYGENVPVARSNFVNTVIEEISPGLLLNLGKNWTLDYTPTWRFYSNHRFSDTLDHNVTLTGGAIYEDWTLGLSQNYTASSQPIIETGAQTTQENYLTEFKASYQINGEASLDLGLDQTILNADAFESYRQWSTLDWLNYQFWPRLTAGVGVGGGYVDVVNGTDMTFEQLQARVAWRATDKVSFIAQGGFEVREFRGGGRGDVINPIALGRIEYKPFDYTQLALTADHSVTVSYFQNEVSKATEIVGSLNQRLLGKFYLDLDGGYHRAEFIAAANSAAVSTASPPGRTDNYYTFDAKLTSPFLKRGRASVFYQYSDNSSTTSGFTFISRQVGLEIGYRF